MANNGTNRKGFGFTYARRQLLMMIHLASPSTFSLLRQETRAIVRAFYAVVLTLATALPARAFAADISSVQNGAWGNPSTWQGGSVPSSGDTATIRHTVTVAGSPAIHTLNLQPGSRLTVNSGATLSVAQGGNVNQATLVLLPGSVLNLSARLSFTNQALLDAECTDVQWCTVSSPNDLGGLQFSQGAQLLSQFTHFVGLGSATSPAVILYHPVTLSVRRSRFVAGGSFQSVSSPTAIDHIQVIDSSWEQTQSDVTVSTSGWNALTTGSRILRGNVFDKLVKLVSPRDFTLEGNYFHAGYESTQGRWRSFKGNLVRHAGIGMLIQGDTKDNFWLIDEPGLINPHFFFAGPPPSIDLDGEIFEFTGTDGNGDCLLASDVSELTYVSLRNSIVLPNAGWENSGTLLSALGGPGVRLYLEHNTYFTGSQGAVVGETYSGHSGILASFRSNIAWDNQNSTRGFLLSNYGPAGLVYDLAFPDALSHNTVFGLLRTYDRMNFSSGVPGAGDISTDPQFVEPTRDIASWDASLGGPGTVASALAGIRHKNDPGMGGTPYQIGNLITYIRQGFYPQNPSLHGTAHDGTTRGAVQSPDGSTLSGPPPVPVISPTPTPSTPTTGSPGHTPSTPTPTTSEPGVTIVDPSTGVIITVLPPIIVGSGQTQSPDEVVTTRSCTKKKRKRCRRQKKRITKTCKCKKKRGRRSRRSRRDRR